MEFKLPFSPFRTGKLKEMCLIPFVSGIFTGALIVRNYGGAERFARSELRGRVINQRN